MRTIVTIAASLMILAASAQPKILAHRGFCTREGKVIIDENSIAALKAAQEAGCDIVEFDVHMTLDKQLVIRHDAKIEGDLDCQKSLFKDIRAYRLPFGSQIPTLEEWFTTAKQEPRMLYSLEIKKHYSWQAESECIEKIVKMVHDMGMEDRVSYLSFNPKALLRVLELDPKARCVLNSSRVHEKYTPQRVKEAGFSGVSYSVDAILNNYEWIEQFKAQGTTLYLWMVNSRYLVQTAVDLGFDVFTTDYFDLTSSYLKQICSDKQQ